MSDRAAFILMRCPVSSARLPSRVPTGVDESRWVDTHAREVHALLAAAYAEGQGEVDDYETWSTRFIADSEFDPQSCFLLFRGSHLVAAALCWRSAFIKDLCVAEQTRRCGLGSYLLQRALAHFHARGAQHVDLKVRVANREAQALYLRNGFAPVFR